MCGNVGVLLLNILRMILCAAFDLSEKTGFVTKTLRKKLKHFEVIKNLI